MHFFQFYPHVLQHFQENFLIHYEIHYEFDYEISQYYVELIPTNDVL